MTGDHSSEFSRHFLVFGLWVIRNQKAQTKPNHLGGMLGLTELIISMRGNGLTGICISEFLDIGWMNSIDTSPKFRWISLVSKNHFCISPQLETGKI